MGIKGHDSQGLTDTARVKWEALVQGYGQIMEGSAYFY